jgi:hypothetical protein
LPRAQISVGKQLKQTLDMSDNTKIGFSVFVSGGAGAGAGAGAGRSGNGRGRLKDVVGKATAQQLGHTLGRAQRLALIQLGWRAESAVCSLLCGP